MGWPNIWYTIDKQRPDLIFLYLQEPKKTSDYKNCDQNCHRELPIIIIPLDIST
jgi:hypothetical protein